MATYSLINFQDPNSASVEKLLNVFTKATDALDSEIRALAGQIDVQGDTPNQKQLTELQSKYSTLNNIYSLISTLLKGLSDSLQQIAANFK